MKIRIETVLEGIMQKGIDYDNFSKELEELSYRYNLVVTTFTYEPEEEIKDE